MTFKCFCSILSFESFDRAFAFRIYKTFKNIYIYNSFVLFNDIKIMFISKKN